VFVKTRGVACISCSLIVIVKLPGFSSPKFIDKESPLKLIKSVLVWTDV